MEDKSAFLLPGLFLERFGIGCVLLDGIGFRRVLLGWGRRLWRRNLGREGISHGLILRARLKDQHVQKNNNS
jgi:hypothetical protein